VVQGLGGDFPASQHARYLAHALGRPQVFDGGVGLAVAGELADQQMVVGLGRDLG